MTQKDVKDCNWTLCKLGWQSLKIPSGRHIQEEDTFAGGVRGVLPTVPNPCRAIPVTGVSFSMHYPENLSCNGRRMYCHDWRQRINVIMIEFGEYRPSA
jgi:hypothetical protein